ncbi:Archaetidylinositol phosphate synthase [Candidatus Lokiarchaeum ossiferum]|uniref:Archaetidylinositol phosphate synthase n=1 Tax=Candidatus Lokiarchaeum ossiferum TaxID=2951803 RepID=A0ABY6HYR0_9ARCH|nr:Archaetidylinositol phosphate synthase [Candidatus Lokiarchaeum sp. B-35]
MLLQMKKYSGKLLSPLGKKISHVPANYITICSLVSCIVVCISLAFQILPLAIIFLFLIEFFDQLDGVVARIQGATKFGAFLDSTLDRYGDIFLYVGIMLGNYTEPWIVMLSLVGAFLTSYTRARVEALGISSLGGIGLLERTDRVPILMIGTIFQFWFNNALEWTVIILMIGGHFTAIQRIFYANRHLSKIRDKKIEKDPETLSPN